MQLFLSRLTQPYFNTSSTVHLPNKKLIRITTVPMALRYLLPGQMRFMSENGFDVLMISANGTELNEVIANENCSHIIVPLTRKITPFRDLQCLFQLIRIFKKEQPDIVHTHTPKAGLLGMLAAKFSGIKIRIHTVAGLPMMVEKGWKYQLLKFTEKITYGSATHVWPNSNSLLEFIKEKQLCDGKKLKVIGKGSSNGIDLNRFNSSALDENVMTGIKSSTNYSSSKKYLLFIGRLVADKGIIELVNVFIQLQKEELNLQLLLVGDFEDGLAPLPASIKNTINTAPAIIHIAWTDKVEYYMKLADLFVFPSHREGFPNVLLQAGAMGLPIACSRIAGNVDIVQHDETGLLFDEANDQQMREMIGYAMLNPAKMQNMATNLQQVIDKDFRRENIWQNILAAYKSSLH